MPLKGDIVKKATLLVVLVVVLVVGLVVTGCSPDSNGSGEPSGSKGTITVGSKIDTEGELLSSIIKLKLEDAGYKVVDKSQTGTTDVVRKALLDGEIDIYPEYTGSGLIFFEGSDPATYKDAEKGYETVKQMDLDENGVVWLTPARANNTWLIALRKDFAEKENLKTMSDFAAYVKAGKTVKLAGSDEFFTNADAHPAFEATYGYSLAKDQQVRLAGGNTAQTETAVAEGTEGVNFGMAYGTDGALSDLGLTVLEDDKGAQLVYWPCPITRTDIIEKYSDIEELLKGPFDGLTIEKLQELNARIQVAGEAADTVARDYLESGGYIGK
jgi:osmoprotectant transport system substrate-binding protein